MRFLCATDAALGRIVNEEEEINLDQLERDLIIQAIQKTGGNKTHAAELQGIPRRRLYSMMERFGITEF